MVVWVLVVSIMRLASLMLMFDGSWLIRGADAVINVVLASFLPGLMTLAGLIRARIITTISLIPVILGMTIAGFHIMTVIILII